MYELYVVTKLPLCTRVLDVFMRDEENVIALPGKKKTTDNVENKTVCLARTTVTCEIRKNKTTNRNRRGSAAGK